MTNKDYCHILAVVDRSGSMEDAASDMCGALNQLFSEQASQPGKCLVDYAMFDDKYELVFTNKPAAEAKAVLTPRGMTALLDAIGRSVVDLGQRLANLSEEERPGNVIVVVVTDGFENASVEWTAEAVKDLIAQQEAKYSWDFVFLGANMDAVDVGTQYGFSPGSSLTYDINNTSAMASATSGYVTRTRTGTANNQFTVDERKAQQEQ